MRVAFHHRFLFSLSLALGSSTEFSLPRPLPPPNPLPAFSLAAFHSVRFLGATPSGVGPFATTTGVAYRRRHRRRRQRRRRSTAIPSCLPGWLALSVNHPPRRSFPASPPLPARVVGVATLRHPPTCPPLVSRARATQWQMQPASRGEDRNGESDRTFSSYVSLFAFFFYFLISCELSPLHA